MNLFGKWRIISVAKLTALQESEARAHAERDDMARQFDTLQEQFDRLTDRDEKGRFTRKGN